MSVYIKTCCVNYLLSGEGRWQSLASLYLTVWGFTYRKDWRERKWEEEIWWVLLYPAAVLQHKYQINIDGTVAAYRLPYLLVGDSVVLKQDSIYYEHFYNELQPWKHYIPVRSNLSDLLEKLQWAKDHDEEVRLPSACTQWRGSIRNALACWYTELSREAAAHGQHSSKGPKTTAITSWMSCLCMCEIKAEPWG